MTTMIEQGARALFAKMYGDRPWETALFGQRAQCMSRARAVIEAIREPNEAMVAAFFDAENQLEPGCALGPNVSWQAMIDAMLQESK